MILKETVDTSQTLRQFLRKTWRFSSRLMKELATEKKIFVDKKRRRLNYLLRPGNVVRVDLGWEKNTYDPWPEPIDVLYEDEAILVINKDPRFSVHPVGRHQRDTVLHAVSFYQKQSGSDFKIRFCHRLDRETSGVLLIAKNKWIHEEIARQFREGIVQRTYLALCYGRPEKRFCVEGALRMSSDGIHMELGKEGKYSLTEFRVIRPGKRISLVEARPLTGRTHQIRVHLASIGFPIVGDSLYGVHDTQERQMLHCMGLQFEHPLKKEKVTITAPLKEDFLQEMENIK